MLVAGLRVVQHQSSTSVRVWRGQWADASVGKTKTGKVEIPSKKHQCLMM